MEGHQNELVVKNTLLLYGRTLLSMFVGLFSSRVILASLGVENLGIYTLVGGVVSLFAFLNSALTQSTQRFISFELGKPGEKNRLNQIFSMAINIHALIAILLVIVTEISGLFLLYTTLDIPQGRTNAAFWVIQFSMVALVVNIMSMPFNGLIVAHEDMGSFAYIDLLSSILKLAAAYLLSFFNYDRLILYSVFILISTLIVRRVYTYICSKKYKESKYHFYWDKKLFVSMVSFSGWTLLSSISRIAKTQGVSVIYNIFYGVIANAAMGISRQVSSSISSFASNFTVVFFPRITKSYAAGDYNYTNKLIIFGSKISYMTLAVFIFPVILERNYILHLWLKNVPTYTATFVVLDCLYILIINLTSTISISVRATGKVKKYEMILNTLNLLAILIFYLLFILNTPYYFPMAFLDMAQLITGIIGAIMASKIVGFSFKKYFLNVHLRQLVITAVALIPIFMIQLLMKENFLRLCASTIVFMVFMLLSFYFMGLSKDEKNAVNGVGRSFLYKLSRKNG